MMYTALFLAYLLYTFMKIGNEYIVSSLMLRLMAVLFMILSLALNSCA
jgi:hypothetical protein